MERSGWFDDDGSEPSGERAWRHPSELGRFGSYGASAHRRRVATRFIAALTLGGAGTLVLAAFASMHAFGPANGGSGAAGLTGGTPLSISAAPTLAAVTTRPRETSVATTVATTTTSIRVDRATTTARPTAIMPARVGMRVGNSDGTIPAVIDDDGWIVASTDELDGATEGEAVLDGKVVKVVAADVDDDTGVTRLKPEEPLEPPADQTMAWLGVTCDAHDERTDATPASTTAPVASTTPSAASTTASTASTSSSATAERATTALTSVASSTTTPSTPAVTTTATTATTEPAATPAPAGVAVRYVHEGSPAAAAGLRARDIIVAVGDRPTRGVWALVLAVRHHAPGETVRLSVVRDGRTMGVDVVLATGPRS